MIVADNKQIHLNKKYSSADHTGHLRENYNLDGIIGRSKVLADILKNALMVAPLDVSVLITGKSGTGKTQIAELIHKNSSRRNHPFVELNCAALPENLIENELFGSAAGGHSGATQAVTGKVHAAREGTLFLDEVAELPVGAQSKLLQFLGSGIFYPLGSSKPVKSDVRIITATNINFRESIQMKKFREDLFYRINAFRIHIPPLSERKADIPDLAAFFLAQSCEKHGLAKTTLSSCALSTLLEKEWKGNIRELKHVIEAASIRASLDGNREIPSVYLVSADDPLDEQSDDASDFRAATRQFQRGFLKKKLDNRGWNISQTARDVSLSRTQLYNLIDTLRIKREMFSVE
ncbi:sigma 54-interacting transcriptional regulator [Desulfobacter vibrioformis]|uniref:sigma 54-interacting transcriptional regulator n=1 Tax=Desulfobacter vibrioformis TaxID=34031 RepID=UPI00068DB791|nr:sigma-54 dependent transcriptional regulator [Desulfobacter vibrioformis]